MPSFDLVCRADLQEVDNAVQQTLREIGQRFDFKGQRTEVRREDTAIHLLAADAFKLRALGDILREQLARGGRALVGDPGEAGVRVVNTCSFIGPAKEESSDAILEMARLRPRAPDGGWSSPAASRSATLTTCAPRSPRSTSSSAPGTFS